KPRWRRPPTPGAASATIHDGCFRPSGALAAASSHIANRPVTPKCLPTVGRNRDDSRAPSVELLVVDAPPELALRTPEAGDDARLQVELEAQVGRLGVARPLEERAVARTI